MDVQVMRGSPDELTQWFVSDLQRAVRAVIPQRRFTFAVPGGSVAETFFPPLAAAEVPWQAVDIFWVDERAVPPTDVQSNYALATRLWLDCVDVPASSIHRMRAEQRDLGQAVSGYARELAAAAGSPPVLDYVLLGVGEDGHVASIFPGHAEGTGDAAVAWTDRAAKPPSRRMTLGLGVLASARRVVVAAFGASKEAPVQAALSDALPISPLGQLLRSADRPVVLVGSAR